MQWMRGKVHSFFTNHTALVAEHYPALGAVSLEDAGWAYGTVMSRKSIFGANQACLVPLMDLMNHR